MIPTINRPRNITISDSSVRVDLGVRSFLYATSIGALASLFAALLMLVGSNGSWALALIFESVFLLPIQIILIRGCLAVKMTDCVAVQFDPENLRFERTKADSITIPWRSISKVHQHLGQLSATRFTFTDSQNQVLADVRFLHEVNSAFAIRELIRSHLPDGAVYQRQEPIGRSGSRRQKAAFAVLGTPFGVAAILLLLKGVNSMPDPTPLSSWVVDHMAALAIVAFLGCGFGFYGMAMVFLWKGLQPGGRLITEAPLVEPVPLKDMMGSFLCGVPVRKRVRYSYSEKRKAFDVQKNIRRTWLLSSVVPIILATCFGAMFAFPAKNQREAAPAEALVFLTVMVIGICAMMFSMAVAYARQIRLLQIGFHDAIVLDGNSFWIDRGAVLEPVDEVSWPRHNTNTRDSSGLNSTRMRVQSGGEERWYDITSMTEASFYDAS